jgi:predicted Zn-dependent protease
VLSFPLSAAYLVGLCSVVLQPRPLAAERPVAAPRTQATLQETVDTVKASLSIEHPVVVSIVANNTRVVSVAAPPEAGGPFQLAVDAAFLDLLTDDELTAALAHELGHVWVFTHHPYLQTERLANEIAMRVVDRASLERVYGKVWARDGTKGDLVSFLGH